MRGCLGTIRVDGAREKIAVDHVIPGAKNDPVGTGMELTHPLAESILGVWRNPDMDVCNRLLSGGTVKELSELKAQGRIAKLLWARVRTQFDVAYAKGQRPAPEGDSGDRGGVEFAAARQPGGGCGGGVNRRGPGGVRGGGRGGGGSLRVLGRPPRRAQSGELGLRGWGWETQPTQVPFDGPFD